jgi:UrcA family protein
MAMSVKLSMGAAVGIMLFVGAVAFADSQPAGFDHSSAIRFADLDLNRPHDVAKLYNRIALAADKLCGRRSLVQSYSQRAGYQSCYRDTVAQAVAQVHQSSLSAYFRLQGKSASAEVALAPR